MHLQFLLYSKCSRIFIYPFKHRTFFSKVVFCHGWDLFKGHRWFTNFKLHKLHCNIWYLCSGRGQRPRRAWKPGLQGPATNGRPSARWPANRRQPAGVRVKHQSTEEIRDSLKVRRNWGKIEEDVRRKWEGSEEKMRRKWGGEGGGGREVIGKSRYDRWILSMSGRIAQCIGSLSYWTLTTSAATSAASTQLKGCWSFNCSGNASSDGFHS